MTAHLNKENLASSSICKKFIQQLSGNSRVLEIGPGLFHHTKLFIESDKIEHVSIKDRFPQPELMPKTKCSYFEYSNTKSYSYNAVWCSHVLEHIPNMEEFLWGLYCDTNKDSLLGFIVPPYKPNLVGGHTNLFTPLSLVYNLVRYGHLDCSEPIAFGKMGYNIYIILNKKSADIPYDKLKSGKGDIEILSQFFPKNLQVKQNSVLPIDQDYDYLQFGAL